MSSSHTSSVADAATSIGLGTCKSEEEDNEHICGGYKSQHFCYYTYLNNFANDVLASSLFFITFVVAISKSSWVI